MNAASILYFSYCNSLQHCDKENCGTCVASDSSECHSNDDCKIGDLQNLLQNASLDTRPRACLLHPLTNALRCLPTCPLSLENTFIEDPYSPTDTYG